MVALSWKNGFKIWKSNIVFLSVVVIVFAILYFGNILLSFQYNSQSNNLMDFTKITDNNFYISILSSLIYNAIFILIICKFNNVSIHNNFFSKRIFLCLIIITSIDNLSLIYKPITNKTVIVLLSLAVLYIRILLFLFPYLIVRNNVSISEGLKQSKSYIKGNIYNFIVFSLSFAVLGIIPALILFFTNDYTLSEIKQNIMLVIGLVILTSLYYLVYSFYLSATFAFAENVIVQNESIVYEDLDETESNYEIENKTEEEIHDDKLFKELNPDFENLKIEQRIQNQFDNYEPFDYKEFIFQSNVKDLTDFDVIDFIMQTDLYMCLKEDYKIQKYIKNVFSYVVIDILGYEKYDIKCNYLDYFKVNNNNFIVEVIIYKGYDDYDITIILTINGENLF